MGILVVIALLLATPAFATCNVVAEQVFDPANVPTTSAQIGDVFRVRLDIRNSDIQVATLRRVSAALNCPIDHTTFGCHPDPDAVFAYRGHVTTTCPTSWTTGHYFGSDPNEVTFEAANNLVVSPGTGCSLWYDTAVVGGVSGQRVAQIAGFRISADDVTCADGSRAGTIDANQVWRQ